MLITPIVLTLIDYTQTQLRIEYTLNVSEQLKGNLDYYLHTDHTLLVIEAKHADLARGFTQLAVELLRSIAGVIITCYLWSRFYGRCVAVWLLTSTDSTR